MCKDNGSNPVTEDRRWTYSRTIKIRRYELVNSFKLNKQCFRCGKFYARNHKFHCKALIPNCKCNYCHKPHHFSAICLLKLSQCSKHQNYQKGDRTKSPRSNKSVKSFSLLVKESKSKSHKTPKPQNPIKYRG